MHVHLRECILAFSQIFSRFSQRFPNLPKLSPYSPISPDKFQAKIKENGGTHGVQVGHVDHILEALGKNLAAGISVALLLIDRVVLIEANGVVFCQV